jgi:hypothetical protein
MQPLAQFQIELVEDANDGGRHRRAQHLFHGPQGFFAMGGLDQDQAARIETERGEAVTIEPPMRAIGAQPVSRHDEDKGPQLGEARCGRRKRLTRP